MKQQEQKEQRVEEILQSLDGIGRAGAGPHLYTRIRAALQEDRSAWSGLASFLSRPLVAVCLVLVLLAANTWILLQNQSEPVEESTEQIMALAQEYRFQQNSLIDQNSNQP